MERKIVFLFEVHPLVTYARRYDYKTLINAGYTIEICDLSGVISNFHASGSSQYENTEKIKYYTFYDRKEFKNYINRLDKDAFIWSTFQLTSEYYWIFKIISKHHYGFICNVDYVFPRSESRKKEKGYWTNLSWHRISNAILYRMPRSFIPTRKADAVITYGINDVERKLRNVLYDDHTIVELTNTIDYYECLEALNAERSEMDLPEEYIVFIDEYMPYHPDGLQLGLIIDDALYYTEVESFLKRISHVLNLPVIIAAHPKADYNKHSECYKGMKIIQYKTAELIQGSKLVITHMSIANGMIIISRKPFIIITTNDIERVIYSNGLTKDQAKDLDREVINISRSLSDAELNQEIKKALSADSEYYDKQISKYRLPIDHPNQSLTFGQILIKAMERVEESESKTI